jgi:hypothetical protein
MNREQGQDEGWSQHTMLAIAWNLIGFHLIDAMPKEEKHSARCHINNITISICHRLIRSGKGKLVIHPNNSRYHTTKVVLNFVSQRKVRFAPHSPDFPEIIPSDFSFSFAWNASCEALIFRPVRNFLLRYEICGRDLTWNFTGRFSRLDCMVRKYDHNWWELLWINDQAAAFILHNSAERKRYYSWAGHSV